MRSLVPKEPAPKLDHGAHLLRLSLEIGQIATILVTIVALARSGLNLVSGGTLAAAVMLTVALTRTPRPPASQGRRLGRRSMTDGAESTLVVTTPQASSERAGWGVMAALAAGYIGIYLCRKNLAVAVPMLQQSFGATKAQIGVVASIGTLAYAAGKVINGPIVDRVGGRRGFLVSLAAVALFGAAGAFASGLWALTLVYGLNRFAGSAAWGAMVKLVPSWFGPARTGTAVALLSLTYDRIDPRRHRWWMAGTLGVLAMVIAVLPRAAAARPLHGAVLVGAIGLLVYGPYSLLAGALAVESGGAEQAATAAGIIDGAGYLAGALAGAALGRVLDIGGYSLGFSILAGITGVSALIALALRPAAAPRSASHV